MNNKLSAKRQAIWSDYWVKGVVSSCSEAIASDDSEVELFWKACAKIIHKDIQLVDLCTGKGIVIKSLLDELQEQSKGLPKCYGVDFARYKPESNQGFTTYPDNVHLLLGTSIDSIPLADRSVTCFVSQYGIEYALSEEFYNEIDRLLASGGTLHAVLHHHDSVLCMVAEQEIGQIEYLVSTLKLFDLAKELLVYFALLQNPANAKKLNSDNNALRLREKYNQKTAEIEKQINNQTYNSILTSSLEVCGRSFQIARTHGKKQAKELLKAFLQELEDSAFRSQELINAALNQVQMQNLLNQFESKFTLTSELTELKSNGQIVAWGLKVTRL